MTATTAGPAWRLPRLGGLPWVTLRQHRLALAGVVAVLGGVSLLMLFTGLAMRHDYHALTSCGPITSPACELPWETFSGRWGNWALQLPRVLMFLPAALGMFVGAPIVARELETGTFRFAWTQGRNRVRWIVTKLTLLGGVLLVLALAFSVLFTWWFAPFDPSMGRISSGGAYEDAGIVFAARTLFAFALGALLGTLIRRTVPAIAATAAVWLAVAWPGVVYLRPLIQSPITVRQDSPKAVPDDAWVIHQWTQDAAGHHLDPSSLVSRARADGVNSPNAFDAWMHQHGYAMWSSYQPNSRFWHFQLVEASCYTVLALLLAAATVWWVRRRAT